MTSRAALILLAVVVLAGACVQSPPGAAQPSTTVPPVPAVATTPTTAAVDPTSRLVGMVREWVFRVRNVNCLATGSSFAVRDRIATNRHVAEGATSLQLATWDGTDFAAPVDSISTGPDLAVLSETRASVQGRLASDDPPVGSAVWAAGYPLGDQLALTPGHVIDYVSGRPFGLANEVMRVTNSLQPGNSGGPLVDGNGSVVGVVFAIQTSTQDGLAIPIAVLSQYLANPIGTVAGSCANG